MGQALTDLTGGATEFDRKLCWYRHESDPGGRVRITLGARSPERIVAEIDGKRRPTYRCGGSWGAGGFRWVEWPPDVAGRSARSGPVPVYVQQHALDRLRERLPISARQRNSSFVGSLANPVVTRRDRDAVLVQFRVNDELHVGHLVARRAGDAAVVTTFLLVTMQGTPEADRLYREACLRRPDVEYAGLDRLIAYDQSLGRNRASWRIDPADLDAWRKRRAGQSAAPSPRTFRVSAGKPGQPKF